MDLLGAQGYQLCKGILGSSLRLVKEGRDVFWLLLDSVYGPW